MSSKNASNFTRRWSLATWLTVWYSALSITIVACVTAYSYWVLTSNLRHEDDEFVAAYLKDVSSRLPEDPDEIDELRNSWNAAAAEPSPVRILMRVLQIDGTVLVSTPGSEQVPWPAAHSQDSLETTELAESWRCLSQNAFLASGTQVVLQAVLEHRPRSLLLARYRKQLYLVLFVAAVACAIGGVLLARQGLRPLRELSSVASGIQANQMNTRLDSTKYAAELEQVATTFNRMLDRLQESFVRLNRFSGDIAHELRTPLHNLQGQVEVALTRNRSVDEYRDLLGSCLEETIRLSRLVDSLLFLARSENPQSALHRESLHLGHELKTLQEFYEAAAEEGGVKLSVVCQPDLNFTADRALFQRAIGNLMTNALAHTRPGGHIDIHGHQLGPEIVVAVIDTGEGILPEHLPYVFDRLFRAQPGHSGHGLGLAIVKSITELHGGRVHIKSRFNEGTTVETYWPVNRSDVN